MKTKKESPLKLRQRKLFLVMPLLTLPFVTILFWLLGGGKMEATNTISLPEKGFNAQLPNPNFEEATSLDKMSYYDAAALDSIKMEELIKKDPSYIKDSFLGDSIAIENESISDSNIIKQRKGALKTVVYNNPNEEKVYAKLEALQKVINQPMALPKQHKVTMDYETASSSLLQSKDVDRLEQMMESMNRTDAEDPELQKLSGMLENILDIQHPDRVKEKMRQQSEPNIGQVFSVSTVAQNDIITSLQNKNKLNRTQFNSNAFYSLDETEPAVKNQNSVEAVIHETQTLVNGSTVKLRLHQAIFVNGVLIPKDLFLFGIASLKAERLIIKISNLRYNNSIFPVDLSVYDMDGIEGIYIPGAITRDVSKASADRSIQTLGVSALDDSWGAQAAGMGIEAAKNILSKKVKLIKVTVKAGYQLLIRDENQKRKDSN